MHIFKKIRFGSSIFSNPKRIWIWSGCTAFSTPDEIHTTASRLFYLLLLTLLATGCQKDELQPENTKNPIAEKSRIWLHRCNSTAKAMYARTHYSGMEIDIFYIDSLETFSVKHDAYTPDTLLLTNLLSSLPLPGEYSFWLDFKNLDQNNMEKSASVMTQIVNSLKIPTDHFIVENYPQNLQPFYQAGFLTSYYIPWFNAATLTQAQLEEKAANISQLIAAKPVHRLSCPWEQLWFLQKYFKSHPRMTWNNNLLSHKQKIEFSRKTLSDHQVKVLLMSDYSIQNQ